MQLGLLYQLLCKHKTVATLEPIRGVSLLTYINEGGTTLRRPFEDVVFCFHFLLLFFRWREMAFPLLQYYKNKMNKGDIYGIQIRRN